MKNKLNSSIGKKYKRKENNLSEARNKAILILENIADSMGDIGWFKFSKIVLNKKWTISIEISKGLD